MNLTIPAAVTALALACSTQYYRAEAADARAQHKLDLAAIAAAGQQHELELAAERRRSTEATSVLTTQFKKDETDAKEKMDRLRADVRAGAVRLRVATASCRAGGRDGLPGAGSTTGGADAVGSAELDRSATEQLLDITADGDAAIRKLTKLQDYAREAMRVCGVGQ